MKLIKNKLLTNNKYEKPHLTDTSNEASIVYYKILRKLSTKRRGEICFELSNNLRQIVEDGISFRHPEYNRKMIKRELCHLMLGESLFRQVFGQKQIE